MIEYITETMCTRFIISYPMLHIILGVSQFEILFIPGWVL